jgi:predicted acylesterase/phospholipase RssA
LVDGGMLSDFPVNVVVGQDWAERPWPTLNITLSGRPRDHRLNDVHGVVTLSKAMLT